MANLLQALGDRCVLLLRLGAVDGARREAPDEEQEDKRSRRGPEDISDWVDGYLGQVTLKKSSEKPGKVGKVLLDFAS